MIPEVDFHQARTVRLVATAYINEPAVTPLADDDDEIDVLNDLEGLTSARIGAMALPADVDRAELLTESYGFGHTFINAAFCHARPGGSRFNGAERGCWYAAFGKKGDQTALSEIKFHMRRVLEDAGSKDEFISYRQILAGFSCRMHDLRDDPDHASLNPYPDVGYPAGQALAQSIRAAGGNGVLYPSTRLRGGFCLAAFRPSVIQNVRLGELVNLRWDGTTLNEE